MPPVVALLNYTSCGILWRIFSQTGIFAGFSLHIINLAVRISAAAMTGDIIFFRSSGRLHWGSYCDFSRVFLSGTVARYTYVCIFQAEA